MHFSIERFRLRTALVGTGVIVITVITLVAFAYYSFLVTNTRKVAQGIVAQKRTQFKEVTALTSAELQALRTYRNKEHVERARLLGISGIADRAAAQQLVSQEKLVPLETNPYFVVRDMDYSVPYVTESTANLLQLIGVRFQEALRARGLPPYKYVITSATRTRQDQLKLQGVNINAAEKSSHEFGTTVDLHYAEFAYAPEHDSVVVEEAFGVSRPLLEQYVTQEYERMAKAQQKGLKAILGRVLRDLQEEGKVLVIYERRQPVYHITLGRDLSALLPAARPDSASMAQQARP